MMRTRLWNNLSNIKFKVFYTEKWSKIDEFLGKFYSFILSFVAAGSVAGWSLWKEYPVLWGAIITISQLMHVAKPYVPFIGDDRDMIEMSHEFDLLYLKYEKLWYNLEYDKLSKEDAEDQLYVLKEEECKIEKKYRKLYCPEIKRFTEDTQKKTYHFLSLNYS